MNPGVLFLSAKTSLAAQVAQCLLDTAGEWESTEVWVPTAGAEHAIRSALSQQGNTHKKFPRFCQPMEALLGDPGDPGDTRLATRADREVAWLRALEDLDEASREALFPNDFELADVSRLLGFSGVLCDLEDLLAEGAMWPGDPRIVEVCEDDADRWQALGAASRKVGGFLAGAGLVDPNQLRLQRLTGTTPGPRHLFIAAIPDLPHASAALARRWLEDSTRVTVLVWMPDGLPGGFDAWGRPDPEAWNSAPLSISGDQIRVFPNPQAEAAAVASLLREKKNGAGIVVADSGLLPELEAAAGDCGVNAFSPGGRPLSLSEAGRVTLLWMDWRAGGSFFTLRHLLELPSFQAWLCARAVSFGTHREILHIVEFLTVTCLATKLSSASLLLREKVTGFHREEMELRKHARELVDELENISQLDVDGLLGQLYPDAGADDPASAILHLLVQLRASGLLEAAADKEEMTRRLLRRALAREKTHAPTPPDAVVLHGWLEAPWLEVQDLHIAGCQDAVLPGIKRGHAFLPDVARAELQLATQATRRARDAYLLQALCSSRAGPEFRCSFSQKGADGSPALPSSLLLRCESDALPQRVKNLFAAAAGRVRPRRRTNWKWELPADWHKGAPSKISPTDFSQYLRCPVRFYFSRVLGAETFDPEAREMDARQFGTLVHDALEHFAIHDPDLESEKDIAECLLDTLEQRARRMFGPGPGGAVLVQLEAIRVRLRSFARLQARERAEGWRILAAERKLSADEEQPFCINGLPLSAKIDRIDRHEDGTLRILDYKTTAKPKKPVETHFAPAGGGSHVLAAQVCVEGKEKTWADLQLPLYRLIAGRWYPECERIEVAYVVLPADPAHTALVGLPLDAGLLASAVECAEEVAGHVKRGHFWPPQQWPAGWEDPLGPLLVNGRPEDCFGAETISFLKGEE